MGLRAEPVVWAPLQFPCVNMPGPSCVCSQFLHVIHCVCAAFVDLVRGEPGTCFMICVGETTRRGCEGTVLSPQGPFPFLNRVDES